MTALTTYGTTKLEEAAAAELVAQVSLLWHAGSRPWARVLTWREVVFVVTSWSRTRMGW